MQKCVYITAGWVLCIAEADFCISPYFWVGRDSSVGIATRYGLDGTGIQSRWGTRFLAPVQTGPGVHPAPCTMGTASFPGVKRPGRGVNHPPVTSAEIKAEGYTCTPLLGLHGLFQGDINLLYLCLYFWNPGHVAWCENHCTSSLSLLYLFPWRVSNVFLSVVQQTNCNHPNEEDCWSNITSFLTPHKIASLRHIPSAELGFVFIVMDCCDVSDWMPGPSLQ